MPFAVVVIEAGDHLGGRISQLEGLAPWPLQLGPEFIHGEECNVLKDFIDAQGWEMAEYEWPDRYFFGEGVGERRLVVAEDADENDPDVREVHRLFAELPGVPIDRDVTALEWLRDIVRCSDKVLALAESIYANDFGTSLALMGMQEAVVEQRGWNYGEKYLVLDRSLLRVAEALAKGIDVRLGWKVSEIIRPPNGASGPVTIRRSTGESLVASRCVVVAAPITALKPNNPGSITFTPPLPVVKTKAIDRVKVSNSVKVFLAFDAPFWPEGLFDVVCAGCFLPEMWILKYPTTENVGRNSGARMASDQGVDPSVPARTKEVVTFFAAGNLADELSRMERKTVVERALDQMDEMFGTETDPKPSRSRLTGSYVADWRREELVGGAYTYPTLHAFGSREVVAAPDGESVFFAGEATHPGVNPCMQGAMETGLRAAAQVLSAVRQPKSGL